MAVSWSFRCLVWGFVSASVTAYLVYAFWTGDRPWGKSCLWNLIAGTAAIWSALSSVIAFHISTLRCSETHTLITLLLKYVSFQGMNLFAPRMMTTLTKIWKEPRKAQEAFLRDLIARDEDTEYGRRYLRGIKTLEDFRQKHPLTKYDHYEKYFQRLADGEKGVCVAAKVQRFGISSGTTGKGKLIPIIITSSAAVISCIPNFLLKVSPVQKVAMVSSKPTVKYTKSGYTIAPAAYMPDTFSARLFMSAVQNTPPSAMQIESDFEATYIHVLFALTDKNIGTFCAVFASQVYRAFVVLEDEQDMFLEDLSLGRVNPRLNIDEGIRRSLDAALKPDPARVEELRREFAQGFVGIAKRIWPQLVCISTIDISGYMKKLNAKYTKGLGCYSAIYHCTEGMTALNMWVGETVQRYVLLPQVVLVEFIPEEQSDEENPETLLLDEVEVGKRYELAITTVSGFYRYRVGDVVEVVDFREKCPVIRVMYRTGEILNLRSEKIDKLVVTKAIEESLAGWSGASLVDWTCAESPLMFGDMKAATYDQFYLLFVELQPGDLRLSKEQKSLFDNSLRNQHSIYDNYRKAGTICEARVYVVRPGSFRRLQEYVIATSTASYNQFKMPKKLRTKATLDLIMECAVDAE